MKSKLKEAKRFGFIVCITRADIDEGRDLGEVVAVGKKWFLVRIIGDHIRYDGFRSAARPWRRHFKGEQRG